LFKKWIGLEHPVRPCQPFHDVRIGNCPLSSSPATSPRDRDYFRVDFRRRVVVVEKFIDNAFEYSFAYEYWPSGRLETVTTTRANAGVLIEAFDDQA
jgi:hypothetical protein